SNPQLVDRAQEMIMLKVRSSNITESIRSINLLEECMNNCGSEFQDEASKFRFLNQLIRLVSKKYHGADTPAPIKKRIMECLLLWTTEFPQKSKIREVYEMLSKEQEVDPGITPAIEAKGQSVLGIDEAMLAKLIKSNDPKDYKRANLLIQNRVKQEARRMDLLIQYKNILQEVTITVDLLDEMLNTYEREGKKQDTERDCTMGELYHACKKHKPVLDRLPAIIGNLDEVLIIDAVEKNDSLENVIKRYKNLVGSPKNKSTNESALDTKTSGPKSKSVPLEPIKSTSEDLLSDLLGSDSNVTNATTSASSLSPIDDLELLGATAPKPNEKVEGSSANPLDDLTSIFDADEIKNNTLSAATKMDNVYSSLNILEPINVFPTSATSESNAICKTGTVAEKGAYRKLPDIDKLSEDLFQKSLQDLERVYSFNKKGPEKLTLNTLAKEKAALKTLNTSPSKVLPNSIEKQVLQRADDEHILKSSSKDDDDVVLSTEIDHNGTQALDSEISKNIEVDKTVKEKNVVKHLADIEIDLDEVEPTSVDRTLLDEDDIKLTLSFTRNRPSKQVSVIVISAINKSKSPVHDFKVEASVHKPCKVRLLQPTATTMPPCKPFRPASLVNQVMLLLNPTGKPIDVTCIFSYKLDSDPDPIKECHVAKDIPYVE
ncbi:PREDICTED: ADP-ribosylation factor-binding protein GGA1, partial [Rhagoletis zephyria]|uniref:ADP-ribosylation factor-binding protein GGA1 n=1 Tax=Rhagoletis zephyria TaxID=28612 RepID=UPI0008118BFD